MPAAFTMTWTGVGILVGVATMLGVQRLFRVGPPAANATRLTAVLLTALAFGAFAWRFGHQFDLEVLTQ